MTSGDFQLGQYELTRPVPPETPAEAGTSDTTVVRQPDRRTRARQRTASTPLPDWMRKPPAARRTVGDRIGGLLLRLPGAVGLRQRWWVWQDRRRLHERFPVSFKLIAFFACWLLATMLVVLAYGL